MQVGTVREVWRHPVKSLGGERLDSCPVDGRGLHLDRWWALRDPDGKLGSGKSTRRFRAMPGLLTLAARASDDDIGARLSDFVGRPVRLATEEAVSHQDEAPVHLVATASLQWLSARHGGDVDVRRLRPNLLVETDTPGAEERWVGRTLRVGAEVVLRVTHRTERCAMTTHAQADLPTDRGVLRTIANESDLCFGVHSDVVRTGTVHAGDPVLLLDRDDPLHLLEPIRG